MSVSYFSKPYKVGQQASDPIELEYSDIVDRSDFRFADEDAKISRVAEQDTGSFEGDYDYKDGKVPGDDHDPVTMLMVNLRQGKYSKGEIDDIRRALDGQASNEVDALASKKSAAKRKAVQDKIDDALAASLDQSDQDVQDGKR